MVRQFVRDDDARSRRRSSPRISSDDTKMRRGRADAGHQGRGAALRPRGQFVNRRNGDASRAAPARRGVDVRAGRASGRRRREAHQQGRQRRGGRRRGRRPGPRRPAAHHQSAAIQTDPRTSTAAARAAGRAASAAWACDAQHVLGRNRAAVAAADPRPEEEPGRQHRQSPRPGRARSTNSRSAAGHGQPAARRVRPSAASQPASGESATHAPARRRRREIDCSGPARAAAAAGKRGAGLADLVSIVSSAAPKSASTRPALPSSRRRAGRRFPSSCGCA